MRVLVVVLLLALGGAGCQPPAAVGLSDAHSDAIADSIRSMLTAWSEGTRQESLDRLADRYADDPRFIWVEDGRVRYRSVDAIREAVESLKTQFSSERTEFIEPSTTPLAPGVAHVATRFRTTLRRESGSEIRYGGAMTMTLIHTDEGWKMLSGHTSTQQTRSPS